MTSARLQQSQRLRQFSRDEAEAWASDSLRDEATRVFLRSLLHVAELSTLLGCYYSRAENTQGEMVDRIGPAQLRAWFQAHAAHLVPEHLAEVRAALVACGVSDAGGV